VLHCISPYLSAVAAFRFRLVCRIRSSVEATSLPIRSPFVIDHVGGWLFHGGRRWVSSLSGASSERLTDRPVVRSSVLTRHRRLDGSPAVHTACRILADGGRMTVMGGRVRDSTTVDVYGRRCYTIRRSWLTPPSSPRYTCSVGDVSFASRSHCSRRHSQHISVLRPLRGVASAF